MNINFITICGIVVSTTLIVSVLVAPILWDAAGYVEQALNTIYNPMMGMDK